MIHQPFALFHNIFFFFFFFLLTEYPAPTVVVQTRDRSEHGPEDHQVAHREWSSVSDAAAHM